MKKITFFFFLVLSQITFGQAKITETEKLAATCKVWGFLKYYHPKVANGEFNWNNQFLDILPKIDKAQTKAEFSLVLENWIDDLGVIKDIAPIAALKDVEYFDKNFDLNWFNNKLFSKKLSKKLKFIEENRFQGEHYYLGAYGAQNVFAKNENFEKSNFNERNPRLLGFFTYWNLIEYFFPYKYVMDQKWDKTLEEMLPAIIAAKNEDEFFDAMEKTTVKINDSHCTFFKYGKKDLTSDKEKHYLPFKSKIIDKKIIVTQILADSLAEADGIKIGDVITKVNNKTIAEILLENRILVSASNEAYYLKNVMKLIESGFSDSITLEFFKDNKYTSKTMKWYDYHDSHRNEFKKGVLKKKEKFKLLDNNIGYVNMGEIKDRNIPAMIDNLKSTKAIVFDMRNYPNGTYREISNFLNNEEKEFAIYIRPDYTYPGKYKWDKGTKSGIQNNKDNYKGKVIVLLNEDSISQSEWTAMCFQTAPNTTIIGSQTAGADGNVSDFDSIKEFYSRFTGLGVFYPDRRETQRIGIVPNIEIKPTIKGIQEGRDEVLDRALSFIETGK
jgi:C-terminal processing protease CtpA/Prc